MATIKELEDAGFTITALDGSIGGMKVSAENCFFYYDPYSLKTPEEVYAGLEEAMDAGNGTYYVVLGEAYPGPDKPLPINIVNERQVMEAARVFKYYEYAESAFNDARNKFVESMKPIMAE